MRSSKSCGKNEPMRVDELEMGDEVKVRIGDVTELLAGHNDAKAVLAVKLF